MTKTPTRHLGTKQYDYTDSGDPLIDAIREAEAIETVDSYLSLPAAEIPNALERWRRTTPARGRPRAQRDQTPADRIPVRMAASSQAGVKPSSEGSELILSEAIRIDGTDCRFEYSAQPFQVYLRGPIPGDVSGFEVDGQRWPLQLIEPHLYAVATLELWQIDRFKGEGRWIT
jgi:hypothetical protein